MQARSSAGRRILAEAQGLAARPSSDVERTVRVKKANKEARIGMRLGLHPVSGQVVITDLYQGYPAVDTGRLFVGDAVKSINGVRIDTVDLAMQIIRLGEGNIEFIMTNVHMEAVSAIARGGSAKSLGAAPARAPPPPVPAAPPVTAPAAPVTAPAVPPPNLMDENLIGGGDDFFSVMETPFFTPPSVQLAQPALPQPAQPAPVQPSELALINFGAEPQPSPTAKPSVASLTQQLATLYPPSASVPAHLRSNAAPTPAAVPSNDPWASSLINF